MSREYPGYAIAAVGCIVIRGDEILLVKRGYPPRKGYWSVPGGVVEADESLYDAAKRELYEETGLSGEPYGVLAIADVTVRGDQGIRFRYVITDVLFNPETIKGEPRPGGDAVDVSWFKLREVVERRDVTGTTRRLVKHIIEHGTTIVPVITGYSEE
ncbi:MAG: NUDIX hydrolase [Thermoprotei archaeon]